MGPTEKKMKRKKKEKFCSKKKEVEQWTLHSIKRDRELAHKGEKKRKNSCIVDQTL